MLSNTVGMQIAHVAAEALGLNLGPLLGSGNFAKCYQDDSNPELCFKFTTDLAHYLYVTEFALDDDTLVSPYIKEDYGIVSYSDRGEPIYLLHAELLQEIEVDCYYASYIRAQERAIDIVRWLCDDNNVTAIVDIYTNNIMMRTDGTVVLNDPVALSGFTGIGLSRCA